MAELMIIECQNCGNSFKGDISQPFICPKCKEKNVHISNATRTSVFKKTLPDEVKEEIRKEESAIEEKEDAKVIDSNQEVEKTENIVSNNEDKAINPVQAQINQILKDTEQKNKEKSEINKAASNSIDITDTSAVEIIKRLNKLDMEYSIIEALLKEILSRLS